MWVSLNQTITWKFRYLSLKFGNRYFSDLCGLPVFDNSNHFALEVNQRLNNWVCRVVQTLVKNSLLIFWVILSWAISEIFLVCDYLTRNSWLSFLFSLLHFDSILFKRISNEWFYSLTKHLDWTGFWVINLMVSLCYLSKNSVSLNFRVALSHQGNKWLCSKR